MAVNAETLAVKGMKRIGVVERAVKQEIELRELSAKYGIAFQSRVEDGKGGFTQIQIGSDIQFAQADVSVALTRAKERAFRTAAMNYAALENVSGVIKTDVTLGNANGRIVDILLDPVLRNEAFNTAAKTYADNQLKMGGEYKKVNVSAEWRKAAWDLQAGVHLETTKVDGVCLVEKSNPVYQAVDFFYNANVIAEQVDALPDPFAKDTVAVYDPKLRRARLFDKKNQVYIQPNVQEETEGIRRLAEKGRRPSLPNQKEIYRTVKNATERGIDRDVVEAVINSRFQR